MASSHDEHAAEDTTIVYAGFIREARILPEPERTICIHVCGAGIQVQFTSSASHSVCVATRPIVSNKRPRRRREIPLDPRRTKMNVTKVLGLAAVGALLTFAVPAERALALSLGSPGAAAAVQEGSKDISGATEVRWHHRYHRYHRHHRWHHRRHWRRW
jgi:hypothetical protein